MAQFNSDVISDVMLFFDFWFLLNRSILLEIILSPAWFLKGIQRETSEDW